MGKTFNDPAEIIVDEGFLDWFSGRESHPAREWIEWMAKDRSTEPIVQEAVNIMKSIRLNEKPVTDDQIRKAWINMQERMDATAASSIPISRNKARWWWAAAIMLLLSLAAMRLFFPPNDDLKYSAGNGELLQKTLPDGSMVTLNANSQLAIGKGFKGQAREVWLKGEAFFHVKKTAGRQRFVVHTDRFDVIVTGTRFNVANRGDKTSVLLTEGSVFLQMPDGREKQMVPGEYLELQAGGEVEKKLMQQEKVLAWKDRKLVFDNTALPVAVSQIMELFSVNIVIEDKAAADTATISGIVPNDNLDVLIAALEAATGLTATKEDSQNIKLRKVR